MARDSESVELLTAIILCVFRLNARLLDKGDQLVEPLGLTSARWQVLGAIAIAGEPQSAPQIASAMGVTRQGVQKQLNLMVAEDLVRPLANPRHVRSPLHALSETGQQRFDAAMGIQRVWARSLGKGLTPDALDAVRQLLGTLERRLDTVPLPAAPSLFPPTHTP